MTSPWKQRIYFAILVALAFLFYGGFLNDFFFNDDYAWLLEAKNSSQNLSNIFTLTISNFFRPLVHLIFLGEYLTFGLKPLGYHMVATLWHGGNAILFYYVLRDALKVENKALLRWAPVLWVTQSTYAEAVGWISALTNLSLASTILITFIGLGRKSFWMFMMGFIVTFFTKEEGAFLFPLVLVYLFMFRDHDWKKTFQSKESVWGGSIWVIYLVVQFLIQKSGPLVVEQIFQLNLDFILRIAEKLLTLFGNVQAPIGMAWPTLVLLALYGIAIATNTKTNSRKALWFMLIWVVMALIPTSFLNFDSSATRYLYNAGFGVAFILASLIFSLERKAVIYTFLGAWMVTHFYMLQIADSFLEFKGDQGKELVSQITQIIEAKPQAVFNFINPPYAPPAMQALMQVYFKVEADRLLFNQNESENFINLVWE